MIAFARYSVMLGCWNANPKNRPTFEELSDELRQMRTTVTVSIKSFKILINHGEAQQKFTFVLTLSRITELLLKYLQ